MFRQLSVVDSALLITVFSTCSIRTFSNFRRELFELQNYAVSQRISMAWTMNCKCTHWLTVCMMNPSVRPSLCFTNHLEKFHQIHNFGATGDKVRLSRFRGQRSRSLSHDQTTYGQKGETCVSTKCRALSYYITLHYRVDFGTPSTKNALRRNM